MVAAGEHGLGPAALQIRFAAAKQFAGDFGIRIGRADQQHADHTELGVQSTAVGIGAEPGVNEALILSTCNRTELYVEVDAGAEVVPQRWLLDHHQLTGRRLDEFLYRHTEQAAVRHLFRVASSLERGASSGITSVAGLPAARAAIATACA